MRAMGRGVGCASEMVMRAWTEREDSPLLYTIPSPSMPLLLRGLLATAKSCAV